MANLDLPVEEMKKARVLTEGTDETSINLEEEVRPFKVNELLGR